MARDNTGWWRAPHPLLAGDDYRFRIDGGESLPDPRSAWQPEGIHGPSRFVDHSEFRWTDSRWQARPLASAIIYELHIGTFTPEGTFAAAIDRLDHLVELGVTHLEIMPVAEFEGDYGWGYDGVFPFAPHHSYGGPNGLKRLVNACHEKGLAVLLDVVCNHLGPVGNVLARYGPYFTNRHRTPWGDALNFDGPYSDEVRRYFCDNAIMWLRDYHFDGLRLDAVHAIVDTSAIPFLEQLATEVDALKAAIGRHLVLIAESDLNDPRVVRPREIGGFGIDAQWSDDIHHAIHTRLTGERVGYYSDFGTLRVLSIAMKEPYVYAGTHSDFRRRRHGRSASGLAAHKFIAYLQNHDQLGNRAKGERLCQLVDVDCVKIGAALILLSPYVPMLFQGEEWGADSPFQYFVDFRHEPDLAKAVVKGRQRECAEFGWNAEDVADPTDKQTFLRSKLNWAELDRESHADLLSWHKDLIQLRRRISALTDGRLDLVDVHYDEEESWAVVHRGPISIACNFSTDRRNIPLSGSRSASLTGVRQRVRALRRKRGCAGPLGRSFHGNQFVPAVRGASNPSGSPIGRPLCSSTSHNGRETSMRAGDCEAFDWLDAQFAVAHELPVIHAGRFGLIILSPDRVHHMTRTHFKTRLTSFCLCSFGCLALAVAQDRNANQNPPQRPGTFPKALPNQNPPARNANEQRIDAGQRPRDAAAEALEVRDVPTDRPEQKLTDHDRSDVFDITKPAPINSALKEQPKAGRITGFDFARDPLGADKPFTTFDEVMKKESADRDKVMAAQRRLLESRYDLKAKLDPDAKMYRGKPLAVGPTARLPESVSWESLGKLMPAEIKRRGIFPYPSLVHPLQANGGQVFPQVQTIMFPRLERFDVEFDLPNEFLPEFPPAIFLQSRPELRDVSRGQVVTMSNFRELFKEILTPVQLEGLRLLLTPLPQEEFNLTDDRKSPQPQQGVACFDCHVNGHTTGQFHLSPDIRPQDRRFRLDTTSLRGMFNQQIHGSKRSLRSVEDFTEFEQRTAYFNGDPIRPMKKGFQEFPRSVIPHMAQAQNMLDFPPAPKLNRLGRLDRSKATEKELAGEQLFFGKAQCSVCHPAPFYLDDKMHDLHLEEFLNEPGDGPIKTFTLRGIKESPPYLHDGRCLTLEDTVEFFNLVFELGLNQDEKSQLVAFMRTL